MTATIAAPAPAPEPNPSLSGSVLLFDWETAKQILADRRPDWASAVLANEDGARVRVIWQDGEFPDDFGEYDLSSTTETPTLMLHSHEDVWGDVEIACFLVDGDGTVIHEGTCRLGLHGLRTTQGKLLGWKSTDEATR